MSVRVRRWELRARSADPPSAASLLRTSVESALELLAREIAPRWVVLERVELHARNYGEGPVDAAALAREVLAAVRRRVPLTNTVAEGVAAFPYEAAARAGLLAALVRREQAQFPWRAMRHWAASLDDVDGWAREELADALVHVPLEKASWLTSEVAERWLGRWTSGDRPPLGTRGLPTEIVEAFTTAWDTAHEPVERLLAALELFRRWPPARAFDLPRRAPVARPVLLPSRAGHLGLWQTLLDAGGLDPGASFDHPASARLARWAIARALSDTRVPGDDPLLLAFAGEPLDGRGPASHRFWEVDPSPLHRTARELAVAQSTDTLRISPLFGGALVLHGSGVVHDVVFDGDALAAIVRRHAQLGGVRLESVEVLDDTPSSVREALLRLDVSALPDPWRAAIIAFGSLLERYALEAWGALPSRDLPAHVDPNELIVESASWTAPVPEQWTWAGRVWRRRAVRR